MDFESTSAARGLGFFLFEPFSFVIATPNHRDVAATIVVSLGKEVVLRGQTRELRFDGPIARTVIQPWVAHTTFAEQVRHELITPPSLEVSGPPKYDAEVRTRLPRSDRAHTCSSARANALLLPFLGQAAEDQPLKCWRCNLPSPCRRVSRCGPWWHDLVLDKNHPMGDLREKLVQTFHH